MSQLAAHLLETIPARAELLCDAGRAEWERVSRLLASSVVLEEAMGANPLPESLVDVLTAAVAAHVYSFETQAITQILLDDSVSPFGRMLAHSLQASDRTNVITTNYDRLVEAHAARVGVRVDSMYYGHMIGRLDKEQSRNELLVPQLPAGGRKPPILRPHPHIVLSKPHGSLDWFSHRGEFFRSDIPSLGPHLIVAPCGNKYREGYEIPFDAQRTRANSAIDATDAFLFHGYGFNDEHLQTHLRRRFPDVPAVIVSRSLTTNARAYLAGHPHAIGIESANNGNGCRVIMADLTLELTCPLWRLEYLVPEVLGA